MYKILDWYKIKLEHFNEDVQDFFCMCMRKHDQGVYEINDYNVFMEFICIVFDMI